MKQFHLCLVLIPLLMSHALAADEDPVVIAHFGDSTCMTNYLPEKQMVDVILNVRLKAKYNTPAITDVNVAEGGDSIRRFIDDGRYDKDVKSKLKRIDIAFIRYGMNDMHRRKNDEYRKDLQELCDKVEKDFAGVRIILETNMYVPHLDAGHNKRFDEIWDIARQVAKERNYPVVENFGRMKKEFESGNKDLCIRNQKMSTEKFGFRIVDDVVDKEMASEPKWFSDAHPNYNANKMIADEEFKLLTSLWPQGLPRADQSPANPPAR